MNEIHVTSSGSVHLAASSSGFRQTPSMSSYNKADEDPVVTLRLQQIKTIPSTLLSQVPGSSFSYLYGWFGFGVPGSSHMF